MCNQAVSLIAAELEQRGIATVVLQFLRFVTEKVGPPRALVVPFKHGYPLDQPRDARRQHAVLEQCWRLLERGGTPPLIVDYTPAREGGPESK